MKGSSSFFQCLENVTDEMEYDEIGEVACALLHYAITGERTTSLNGIRKIVFELILAMFNREAVADAWCGKKTDSAEARE